MTPLALVCRSRESPRHRKRWPRPQKIREAGQGRLPAPGQWAGQGAWTHVYYPARGRDRPCLLPSRARLRGTVRLGASGSSDPCWARQRGGHAVPWGKADRRARLVV